MSEFGSAELDSLLSESRKMLRSIRSSHSADSSEGIGESAEAKVRAVAEGGRIREIVLNPRVMRMASAELAEHIVAAVNNALDDLAAQSPQASGEPVVDPAILAEQIQDVQDRGMRQMSVILQGIRDAVAQAQRGAT